MDLVLYPACVKAYIFAQHLLYTQDVTQGQLQLVVFKIFILLDWLPYKVNVVYLNVGL